jgi:hypothetical protein
MISTNTRLVALVGALFALLFVLEMVRRRRLKEEYSLLWVLTAVGLIVLALWYDLLVNITDLIGGVAPSSTLFFFGLIFVFAMLLHFSVRVSMLERRITALVQELGLMSVVEPDAPGALPVAPPDQPEREPSSARTSAQ